MKNVSNTGKILLTAVTAEGLSGPAVLTWPMSEAAESDRLRRDSAFRNGLGDTPPAGLAWIRSHADSKYNPEKVLTGTRSVLVFHLPYFRDDPEDHLPANTASTGKGRVARYARGRDYHKELGGRLKRIVRALREAFPGEGFRAFTDIGPLDETWLAEASGMGFKGRHTLAILPGVGSWAVLGHIVTTLVLEPFPGRPSPLACPDGCRRCIDACPTGALSPPGRLNAEACLSYQTIELKGSGNPEYAGATGSWIFGCDACQEVCPFNVRVLPTDVTAFTTDIAGAGLSLPDVLELKDHDDTVARFAGSALMRAGRVGMVRNACTVAGNSGDNRLIPQLEKLIKDEDEGVRSHAERALTQLRQND